MERAHSFNERDNEKVGDGTTMKKVKVSDFNTRLKKRIQHLFFVQLDDVIPQIFV